MVQESINATNARFLEALRRGDAAACADVYVQEGRLLPPNSPMVQGKDDIKNVWQALIDMGAKEATLKTVELDTIGDTAVETGAYTLKIQPEGAEAVQDTGKYVVVWKRESDGDWKWAVDIFNSDLPAN